MYSSTVHRFKQPVQNLIVQKEVKSSIPHRVELRQQLTHIHHRVTDVDFLKIGFRLLTQLLSSQRHAKNTSLTKFESTYK